VSDLIKRRYYNLPLKVNVYSQSRELADGQAVQSGSFKSFADVGEISLLGGFDDTFASSAPT